MSSITEIFCKIDTFPDTDAFYKCVKAMFSQYGNELLNSEILYKLWTKVHARSEEMESELFGWFLKDSDVRYHEYIEPYMNKIDAQTFDMGTPEDAVLQYVG